MGGDSAHGYAPLALPRLEGIAAHCGARRAGRHTCRIGAMVVRRRQSALMGLLSYTESVGGRRTLLSTRTTIAMCPPAALCTPM